MSSGEASLTLGANTSLAYNNAVCDVDCLFGISCPPDSSNHNNHFFSFFLLLIFIFSSFFNLDRHCDFITINLFTLLDLTEEDGTNTFVLFILLKVERK